MNMATLTTMLPNEQLQPTPELTSRVPRVAPATARLSCGVRPQKQL